jgi:ring-1,2-phenylacetyl-CoA epoxidase subunit PaaD
MDAADLSGSALVSVFAPVRDSDGGLTPQPREPLSSAARVEAAWQALARVEDPEIPVLSVLDLGLIRTLEETADGVLRIGLSPTYTGCPATEVIRARVSKALVRAGLGPIEVRTELSPAWSTDWITSEGRRKLEAYGIAPPTPEGRELKCPRCGSGDTERVSAFGSTPCKALHRCRACLEPFEAFKCL